MRKEVKQGFAIGGVLLSVLVVYVLVISGGSSDKPQPVTLATSDSPSASTEKPPTPSAVIPPAPVPAPEPAKPAEEPKKESVAAVPTTAPDPFKSNVVSEQEPWAHGVLQTGELPVMMTQTPQKTPAITPIVASTSGDMSSNSGDTSPAAPKIGAPPTGNARETIAPPPSAVPNQPMMIAPPTIQQPHSNAASASGKPGTHVVQSGETFASIAAFVYGNSSYYAHLMRANPSVDPKKLRPGMTIIIPPENEVKADHTVASSNSGQAATPSTKPVDTRTQYVVQPGENLMKIALKLYGKATRADQLYDLNRDLIGSDPNKLKPGMVLKLPEAPVVINR